MSDWLEAIKAAGTIVASLVFGFGLVQYRGAQKWKRQEFCAGQIAAMKADPAARTAMQMLDWDGRRVDLFPHETDKEERWVLVDHAVLARALRPHSREDKFSAVEARIRDVMDDLLDHFERLYAFVDHGLIRSDDLKPYLSYWVNRIGNRNKILDVRTQQPALIRYIEVYGYSGTAKLMKMFGADMSLPSIDVVSSVANIRVDAEEPNPAAEVLEFAAPEPRQKIAHEPSRGGGSNQ